MLLMNIQYWKSCFYSIYNSIFVDVKLKCWLI